MNIIPTTSHEREDAIRVEQVAKKQKEYKLIGKQRRVAGHTLFEFNKKTKEIKTADIKRECIFDATTGKPIYKPRRIYMWIVSIYRHSMSRTPRRNFVN